MNRLKILTYLPRHIKPYAIGNAAHEIASGMNTEGVTSHILSIHSDMVGNDNIDIQVFKNDFIYRAASSLFDYGQILKFSDRSFRRAIRKYDVAYFWTACPLETYRYVKSLGKKIVVENVNCHQQVSRKILDSEAERLTMEDIHQITDEDIADEASKLALADFVFSPSRLVTDSLREAGVEVRKIIGTSYGLDSSELIAAEATATANANNRPFTALFVGNVIPRKGIHLLLDYWQSAKIEGRLKVIGQISSAVEHIVGQYRDDPSIEFVSFTRELASYYQSADLFILPSLEEGSPLVTYLALGAGLPCLVSPMAGDGVVRTGVEGFVIPPHDKAAWVAAIQKIALESRLRRQFSEAARARAEYFLWPLVAHRRITELVKRL